MNGSLRREHRRRTGSYYTPQDIARDIVEQTLDRWIRDRHDLRGKSVSSLPTKEKEEILASLLGLRVLDPSVGDGIFLKMTGEYLETLFLALGDKRDGIYIREDIVKNNLFGVDIQQTAVQDCRNTLVDWIEGKDLHHLTKDTIKHGNSLIGSIRKKDITASNGLDLRMDWYKEFPMVFSEDRMGFDIIVGNPPYGNLLSAEEKEYVKQAFSYDIMSGRDGSWNIAPIFIVRSKDLLHAHGHMGLLLPNSILRVGQFKKTRDFIREKLGLWSITDEGSPFEGVTLEMVSIFCSANPLSAKSEIIVKSRRKGLAGRYSICRSDLQSRIFSIYSDSLFKSIRKRGQTNLLSATRGRDIPAQHTTHEPSREFSVPYATRGRSIGRYKINDEYLTYTDDWFKQDGVLLDSFSHDFLIATKNYPYPRCVHKPKGVVHGGGVVRINSLVEDLDMKAVGLLLNSRLIRFLSIKYLTNYAQLTTCMNTGIVEEIPLVIPEDTLPISYIFDILQEMHSHESLKEKTESLEAFVDALVYSIYLYPRSDDTERLLDFSKSLIRKSSSRIIHDIGANDQQVVIERVMNRSVVKKIESSPRME
ncbi:MAG: Eco57I restriction-modification methylase domain-containing protein [Candidatus Thorarchaeota archaeon]